MAKRVATKRKHDKRGTNAQRRAREYERRTIFEKAERVTNLISRYSKGDFKEEGVFDQKTLELKLSKQGVHRLVGEMFCEFNPNPSRFLRLVADCLEGKWPPYSPGDDWYDDEIKAAFSEACRRNGFPRVIVKEGKLVPTWPTFSQFFDIFQKNNPGHVLVRPPSERSLRRSLKRIGCGTTPDKRGRPRGKRDRKPRLTR